MEVGKHGFYKADVWINGLKREKTFFPSEWSRKKVIAKVMEAYDDFIAKSGMNYLEKGGKYTIKGCTSDGIEIEMYVTKSGQITTAYPKV